jgi:hypothetical protein
MPINGQATLDDVILAGQQGMQFAQQQRTQKRQEQEHEQDRSLALADNAIVRADRAKSRALMDSSEAAVRQVMTDDMAEHVANGRRLAQADGKRGHCREAPHADARSGPAIL